MSKSFYVVTNGLYYSKHKTKEDAICEKELNKLDELLGKDNIKSKWIIKKVKRFSILYGRL